MTPEEQRIALAEWAGEQLYEQMRPHELRRYKDFRVIIKNSKTSEYINRNQHNAWDDARDCNLLIGRALEELKTGDIYRLVGSSDHCTFVKKRGLVAEDYQTKTLHDVIDKITEEQLIVYLLLCNWKPPKKNPEGYLIPVYLCIALNSHPIIEFQWLSKDSAQRCETLLKKLGLRKEGA